MNAPCSMARPHGLIVDNFAGGGGASIGIEAAIGRSVDIAINHDPEAIAMHRANHPGTRHYCQDVWEVDPVEATGGRLVELAWFSPDCKHFSKAKGGKPREKNIRDLAWVVHRWIEALKPLDAHPKVIMLENVEEFRTWGPLLDDGKPCPARKGETFAEWVEQLRSHGYAVQWRELVACDFGAPTSRKRLFLIARRDGQPIVWPEPTHGPMRASPWKTAADIIDWSLPCPSIFNRTRPLKDATCRRIATGIMRYVVNAKRPFIVPVTNSGWNPDRLIPVDQPLPPMGTVVAGGGKHALVAAFMAQHNGGPRNRNIAGHAADRPTSTITGRGTQQQLVTSHLVKLQNNQAAKPVDMPLDTVLAGDLHYAEVRAFLIKYYGNEKDGHGLFSPLGTVTTKDRFGLVTVPIDGVDYAIADIGMRMLSARELYAAQGFPADYRIDCDHAGKPLTKTTQVRMVGNSVCPPLPTALVKANLPGLCPAEREAA